MSGKPPDPRRRFIDLLERECTAAGCETSSHFARHVAARMDAEGLRVVAIPDHTPPIAGHARQGPALPEYVAARAALKEAP